MISEAQKKSARKWDAANMTTVACRITNAKAQAFKEACRALGTVPNRVLNEAISRTIAEAKKDG